MSNPRDLTVGRQSGILVPLFSIPSSRSWGIGEIGDIEPLTAWLRSAGQHFLQLLPVNEMVCGQHSPYTAQSALAVDPIYLSLATAPDFLAVGGEPAMDAAWRRTLERVRAAPRVDYPAVRRLKEVALRAAFGGFRVREWSAGTARADQLRRFIAREAWWLDDYALFRALHVRYPGRSWQTWPSPLRSLEPRAIATARGELREERLFRQWLQWLADDQWQAARKAASPVGLMGDTPFVVATDSADVWTRQEEFRLDAAVGTPPDAFSEEGQDWGLPPCRWEAMARNDYAWLRGRARRSARLYDGSRIDHVVGFYRTYVRPREGAPFLSPRDEPSQRELGERVLGVLRAAGPFMIAEDLGTVPDFVRASLADLDIPGYRVLRWERDWHGPGQRFLDPSSYPEASVATSGTHDTDPLAVWWESAAPEERERVAEILPARYGGPDTSTSAYTPAIRDALLRVLFDSGSRLLSLPIQDVFGWRDVINVPATVTDENWTYRLPWPVDRMTTEPVAMERARTLRAWADASDRRGQAEGDVR